MGRLDLFMGINLFMGLDFFSVLDSVLRDCGVRLDRTSLFAYPNSRSRLRLAR